MNFAPGQSSNSFQVTLVDDFIVNGDQTVIFNLSNPSTNAMYWL
jgi:hypothetical protein